MGIGDRLKKLFRNFTPTWTFPETSYLPRFSTDSGQTVTPETARKLSVVYRCINLLSDDIATTPLQQYRRTGRDIERIRPDAIARNAPYLVELQPNQYYSSYIAKKLAIQNLLCYGAAYFWRPISSYPVMYVLPSAMTELVVTQAGALQYQVTLPGNETITVPWVEVLTMLINSPDGITGKSVLTYAAETVGRRQAGAETQNTMYANGMMPGAVMFVNGTLSKDARDKIRTSYSEATTGSANAGKIAVFDTAIKDFKTVEITPADAQFLETTQATDVEICEGFFGVPAHKLGLGKQSYATNEQSESAYLRQTLNPYFVQFEQAAAIAWQTTAETSNGYYWRFERGAFLQTDAKARAEILASKITTGQLSPNEARAIDDVSPYPGGDNYYMQSGVAAITGNLNDSDSDNDDIP